MKIYERYIAGTVIAATFVTIVALLGMQLFIELVAELQDIGTRDYNLWQAILYVPLLLPTDVYQFFPIAGLIGSLMGLGWLASHSELIAFRAAGVSMKQVIGAVLKTGVLMLLVATLIGEGLAPLAQHYAKTRKALAMSGGQTLKTNQGTWVRDGESFIHISEILPHGNLQGITRYQFNNHQLVSAGYAQNAVYRQGHWLFQNVVESQLGKESIHVQHYPQRDWGITFRPRLLGTTSIVPQEQSLAELRTYIHYSRLSGQNASQYEFIFWQRIFQPLATLIMIALGVPCIFGPMRNASIGLRILLGILLGFVFYMLNQFFGPLTLVYQLSPWVAAALPTLLFAAGGGVLLWMAR
ncbi:MAG: LPS export ABC transporter permease LptG [Gammaproteobacteria bacterium]